MPTRLRQFLRVAPWVAGASLLLLAVQARAVISISEPWVRAAPGGHDAQVYVKLRSTDAATLAAVDSFAAKRIDMRGQDGRRAGAGIELPANTLIELKPDGAHLHLQGLVRRLKPGEHVPVTLIVRSGNGTEQKLFINAEVRKRSPTEDEMTAHSHHHRRR